MTVRYARTAALPEADFSGRRPVPTGGTAVPHSRARGPVSTGTVFLIQNTQHRDSRAIARDHGQRERRWAWFSILPNPPPPVSSWLEPLT